jgi:hypothetical protein
MLNVDGDLGRFEATVIYLGTVSPCDYLMPLFPRLEFSCNDVEH